MGGAKCRLLRASPEPVLHNMRRIVLLVFLYATLASSLHAQATPAPSRPQVDLGGAKLTIDALQQSYAIRQEEERRKQELQLRQQELAQQKQLEEERLSQQRELETRYLDLLSKASEINQLSQAPQVV